MAVLRRAQFYEGTPPVVGGVNTFTLAYTVPAGHVITLKGCLATNNGGATHTAQVRIGSSLIFRSVSLGVGATDNFITDLVLLPAETLYVLQVPGGAMAYFLGGYIYYV